MRNAFSTNDKLLTSASDLEHHRTHLRKAFGDAVSDEFVDVMLGKLLEVLRPNPFDKLEESTLDAGLAILNAMQPRSELEALLSVQIVATGFFGLRFLRQSHRNMSEDFIEVYGGYATKLLHLQAELIQAFDGHRRGHQQTVEVRHVHIYPGAPDAVGNFNEAGTGGEAEK